MIGDRDEVAQRELDASDVEILAKALRHVAEVTHNAYHGDRYPETCPRDACRTTRKALEKAGIAAPAGTEEQ